MTYHVKCRSEHPDWLMRAYDDFLDRNGTGVAVGKQYSAWELFEKENQIRMLYRGNVPHMVEFKNEGEAAMFMLKWT